MNRVREIVQKKDFIEQKLRVKISVLGKKVSYSGSPLDEYEAGIVLEAIEFGFSVKQAILLLDEDYQFRRVHIKDYTRRKNLNEIRARLIGTKGKTKRVVQSVSGCFVVIRDNDVGLIGDVEFIDAAETAVINLIKGSKQSNVYHYLEQMNRLRKEERYKKI